MNEQEKIRYNNYVRLENKGLLEVKMADYNQLKHEVSHNNKLIETLKIIIIILLIAVYGLYSGIKSDPSCRSEIPYDPPEKEIF